MERNNAQKPEPVIKFKAALFYRLTLIFCFLPLLIIYICIVVSEINEGTIGNYSLTVIVSPCLIFLIWWAVIAVHVSKKIIIKDGIIFYSSLVIKKQIPIRQVKGYKLARYYAIIIPHKKDKYKKIRMTTSFPFNQWLSSNLVYLGIGTW